MFLPTSQKVRAEAGIKEYAHHLRIARGSLMELDTQLWIARDLGFIDDTSEINQLIQRIAAMLNALISSKTKSL